jgi:hypothetical protein
MSQQQENSGFKTQHGTRGCRFCFIDETIRGDLDYNVIDEGHYHYQTMSMRKGMNADQERQEYSRNQVGIGS